MKITVIKIVNGNFEELEIDQGDGLLEIRFTPEKGFPVSIGRSLLQNSVRISTHGSLTVRPVASNVILVNDHRSKEEE